MKVSDIRRGFLDYFAAQEHAVVPGSSLIPANDPTLLFTNAGMVQFKDVFLGRDSRPYSRAATAQRCVRAGGKHNDLENVGYTARHHTFFEMLGNFSFGDYFKRDAIRYAWEFLTSTLKISPEKLWVTVYSEDEEAAKVWREDIRIPAKKLVRIATMDNFWQMGDTGPCGPCSEIFYDHGPSIAGGPPGSKESEGDRYVEIWNLVFMQYNRDEEGKLHPLPKPSVDTGMGLERIAAVMQGVHDNYEIDLFRELIGAAARVTDTRDLSSNSLKVIADHIRACAFLIGDGMIPANEGRGYVLRRIIRRAIRHGYKLGRKKPFFYLLVPELVRVMGDAYPELAESSQRISETLKTEEERFAETLENGMQVLEAALKQEDRMLSGETVFRLYDTFGFPLDLTADIARERGFTVDFAGFEEAMERQRERARAGSKFGVQEKVEYSGDQTVFHGYETLQKDGKILAIYREGAPVSEIKSGDDAVIVLDHTPFYAESGGQVGDKGELASSRGTFNVNDTRKIQPYVVGHKGVLATGRFAVGDKVVAKVDGAARARAAYNHSATHLLHAALRQVLGKHVLQKGSLVDPDKTRFDFSHNNPMTSEQIREVEELVNREIRRNVSVETRIMKYDEAVKSGAIALFGEKYEDEVRVLRMGEFSTELCGGTHVCRTGDIGFFKITYETGIAAGIRRVEGITADTALHYVQSREQQMNELATALKVHPSEVAQKISQISENVKSLEKELARLKAKLASSKGDELEKEAVVVNGAKILAAELEGADVKTLRETVDRLKDKLKSAAVVLASSSEGKVNLIAGVTSDLTDKIKAGELANFVASQVGGKGGGRADMAQGGGTLLDKLPDALALVREWAGKRL
jgi:alanyl-tRNA synthetase